MRHGGAPATAGKGPSRWALSPKTSMTDRRRPLSPPRFQRRVRFSSRWKARTHGAMTDLITRSRHPLTRRTETPMRTALSTPRTTAQIWLGLPPTTERGAQIRTAMDGPTLTMDGAFRTAQMPLQANPHNGWIPTMTATVITSKATKETIANSVVVTPHPTVSVASIQTVIRIPTPTRVA